MTIKQQGGIFGRNPTFNDVDVESIDLSVGTVTGNLTLNGSGSGNGLIKNSGTGFGVGTDRWIGADGSDDAWFFNVPTGGQHYFAINNSNKLSISGNDVNVLLGNLVIGTSGKGIDFSATSGTGTSELFSDYEEGSFTPTLTTDATDFSSVTYDEAVFGSYTKVGNVVHIQLLMQTDAVTKGSASGNVIIGGLPFTADGTSPLAVATSKDWLANHPTRAYVADGATTISLLTNANNTADDENIVVADVKTLGNDNTLRLAGTYRAS